MDGADGLSCDKLAEQVVKSVAIPFERPRQSCQCHDEKQQYGEDAASNVKVVAETSPAFSYVDGKTCFQILDVIRNPYHYPADQDNNHQ